MSKIAWTDKTWNPTVGCSRVSDGCENCYAERMAHRLKMMGNPDYEDVSNWRQSPPYWTGEVRCLPKRLEQPLHWRKPRRVFVNSMSDLFHEKVPFSFIAEVFHTMTGECDYRPAPEHTYQILTKRPKRMLEFFHWLDSYRDGEAFIEALQELYRHPPYFSRVWLGVSVENQRTADERIPLLLKTPAALRWVSYEPALGPICFDALWETAVYRGDKSSGFIDYDGVDWLVVGGESGPGARPCEVEWIRSTVQQCKAAGVPLFVKQVGRHCRGSAEGFRADWYELSEGDWWRPPMIGENAFKAPDEYIGFRTYDRKGSKPAEWPLDLRVQEWPNP
jgi:protein gp37